MRKLLLSAIIVIAALFILGCANSQGDAMDHGDSMMEDKKEDVAPPAPSEPVVVEEVVEEPQAGADLGVVELLSDLSCDGSVVTATVTNTQDVEFNVDDVVFRVNAAPDVEPQCDAEVLAPGQSTVCSGLERLGNGKVQVVHVELPDGEQMLQKVTCEAQEAEDDDEDEEAEE